MLAGKREKRISEVKLALAKTFEVKDLGELNHFLGVKIVQNHEAGTIWIGQPTYTEAILQKFGMKKCKPLYTPVDVGSKLTKGTEDSEYIDKTHYQSMVGSLLYLSMRARPDITFAVRLAAQFCSEQTSQHMKAVKCIFRYLRGTTWYGLLFKEGESRAIISYSDADCKSTTGYLFLIGGTAFTWQR